MLTFIYGGARMGKSTYALNTVAKLPNKEKVFLAAMRPIPEFSESIMRQQKERANMGFTKTIEVPFNLAGTAEKISGGSAVLLECMCHLVSGELFEHEDTPDKEKTILSIMEGVHMLKKDNDLYVVSNEISADGVEYDETTKLYKETLSQINLLLAKEAERVIEVCCGFPIIIK